MARALDQPWAAPQGPSPREVRNGRGRELEALAQPDAPSRAELGEAIRDLSVAVRAGVDLSQALMRARHLEELLTASAETAIDQAIDARHDASAIDHAVSSVRASTDARSEGNRALALWIDHLDRVDRLCTAADRLLQRLD